jgi:lipid A 3-O-deacylase
MTFYILSAKCLPGSCSAVSGRSKDREVTINSRCVDGLFVFLVLMAALIVPSHAEGEENGMTSFSVCWENDAFGGTDANYTNGLSLALTQTGPGLTGGIWKLFREEDGKKSSAYDLGQLQFTPDDIERTDPDPADRPYAGLLYCGLSTFLVREHSLQGVKLLFGVVGPASLSEELQELTHRAIGSHKPQGWSYQLNNEPIVNIVYDYRRRVRLTPREGALDLELLPESGFMLGNYLTQASAGLQIRFGYRLDHDFGATTLRGIGVLPGPVKNGEQSWGWSIFTGGSAHVIGWDITLDGNTFARSRNVDKRIFLPAAAFGGSFWTDYFQATFSYVMLGKEFYTQKVREDYGALFVTIFM